MRALLILDTVGVNFTFLQSLYLDFIGALMNIHDTKAQRHHITGITFALSRETHMEDVHINLFKKNQCITNI